ncbi:MAG: hypothetical protein ACI8RD_008802 [Bacillariaceae sp.]|jgi:hypothetical protein
MVIVVVIGADIVFGTAITETVTVIVPLLITAIGMIVLRCSFCIGVLSRGHDIYMICVVAQNPQKTKEQAIIKKKGINVENYQVNLRQDNSFLIAVFFGVN